MLKIRVLVVDDHTIVRDGICALLSLTNDIEVVGEATNGNEALKMVKELNTIRLLCYNSKVTLV